MKFMENEKLRKWRGEVIERFANVEYSINSIISQHYLKRVYLPFFLDILYDEYFSFGLRRRILEKIIVRLNVRELYKKRIQQLNRLNTIRNYFAHCNLRLFEQPESGLDFMTPDPRDVKIDIDFKKLYAEFFDKVEDVEKFLFEFTNKVGVVMTEEKKSKD